MKKKLKRFRIQKRFEVWAEVEVTAVDMDAALAIGKELDCGDLIEPADGATFNDVTEIDGFTVGEEW